MLVGSLRLRFVISESGWKRLSGNLNVGFSQTVRLISVVCVSLRSSTFTHSHSVKPSTAASSGTWMTKNTSNHLLATFIRLSSFSSNHTNSSPFEGTFCSFLSLTCAKDAKPLGMLGRVKKMSGDTVYEKPSSAAGCGLQNFGVWPINPGIVPVAAAAPPITPIRSIKSLSDASPLALSE